MGIKHTFFSGVPDTSTPGIVKPTHWNSDHTIDGDVDFNGHAILNATGVGISDFLALTDTPNSYGGFASGFVNVNSGATALEFRKALTTARGTTKTISAGVITVDASFHYIDTEGAAAFDQLDTINGGVDGQQVTLSIANDARKVWLSAAGNLALGNFGTSGRLLSWADVPITMIYDATKAKWIEYSFFGAGVKNVKDYGAVGDGVTDDSAAIQSAVNDVTGAWGDYGIGTIFFPAGRYKLLSAIQVDSSYHVRFLGDAGAVLEPQGNIYAVRLVGGFNYAAHSFEMLRFHNSSATNYTSGCIYIDGTISVTIKDCVFGLNGGVGVAQATAQDITVMNCVFVGGSRTNGAVGVGGANSCTIIDCDFVSVANAITHNNIGLNIIGGRIEVCGNAITLGKVYDGTFSPDGEVFISGMSMESNSIHILIENCSAAVFSGVAGTSFTAGCTNGLWIKGGNNICFDSGGFSGGYSDVAVRINGDQNGLCRDIIFRNFSAVNVGVSSWNVAEAVNTTLWENTNYTPAFTNEYNVDYSDTSVFPAVQDISYATATIASGAITVSANYMVIDTEGAAGTDDLDNINGAVRGSTGSTLTLRAADSGRTVVVKDGTGNMKLAGDFSLDNAEDTITLIWDGRFVGGTWPTIVGRWLEISRSDNGA